MSAKNRTIGETYVRQCVRATAAGGKAGRQIYCDAGSRELIVNVSVGDIADNRVVASVILELVIVLIVANRNGAGEPGKGVVASAEQAIKLLARILFENRPSGLGKRHADGNRGKRCCSSPLCERLTYSTSFPTGDCDVETGSDQVGKRSIGIDQSDQRRCLTDKFGSVEHIGPVELITQGEIAVNRSAKIAKADVNVAEMSPAPVSGWKRLHR